MDKPHICIFDSEGQVHFKYQSLTEKSRWARDSFYKFPCTVYIKRIGGVKYYYQTGKVSIYDTFVETPPFHTMPSNLQSDYNQWKEIHGIEWDHPGISPTLAFYDIRTWCQWAKMIFAKGTFFESRILNHYGLQGDQVWETKVDMEKLPYKVEDLANFGVRKYPNELHIPVRECLFFLHEMIRNDVLGKALGIHVYRKPKIDYPKIEEKMKELEMKLFLEYESSSRTSVSTSPQPLQKVENKNGMKSFGERHEFRPIKRLKYAEYRHQTNTDVKYSK